MGGKNAVIVDSDADLDEAIVDSIYSAFGYQGQKCSALSRLIVLDENYERVIKRLLSAAASLRVGNPETRASQSALSSMKLLIAGLCRRSRWEKRRQPSPFNPQIFQPKVFCSADDFHRRETRWPPVAAKKSLDRSSAFIRVRDLDRSHRGRQQHRLRAYCRIFLAEPGKYRAC